MLNILDNNYSNNIKFENISNINIIGGNYIEVLNFVKSVRCLIASIIVSSNCYSCIEVYKGGIKVLSGRLTPLDSNKVVTLDLVLDPNESLVMKLGHNYSVPMSFDVAVKYI